VSRKIIKEALKDFGLTQKEAEIYIFLAKHGILTGGEISKQTEMHRPVVYSILKSLQKKGVVESTLESPIRFLAIPFEKIIDENIRKKQEETIQLEKAKMGLLDDWNKIYGRKIEPDVGTFFVIKGNRKIYSKISQMIIETRNNFSAILTVQELVRNEQFGVFDSIYNHFLKSQIKFHFITELSHQNLGAIKLLYPKLKEGLSLKARASISSFSVLPRMVIRDNEEALFFISPKTEAFKITQDEVCICTNNPSLVEALSGIFNELLQDSQDIGNKIFEMETGPSSVIPLLNAAIESKDKWLIFETIQYYLKALDLMKKHENWSKERTKICESLGRLYGLAADHEKANEFYQKGIASTKNDSIKSKLRKMIRRKKIVENNGTKLAYYVYGEGKKTILFIGWISTSELWIPQIAYFSQKYKVVTVDLRGTGESDKPPGDYTVDLFVKDLDTIIDDLSDKEIVFVGLYIGGMVGIKYVTGNSGRISKLVLVNMGPKPMRTEDFPYSIPREKISKFYVNALKSPQWGVKRLIELWFPNPKDEHLRKWLQNSVEKTPPEIVINTFINYNEEDVRHLLKSISIPTLIFGSVKLPEIGQYMNNQIPNSKLVMHKSGLFPNLFEAEEFNSVLEKFITSN
jgi:sugar-specific transcriptional regulator TrmB/pimeloyl-ACP methyl ester carboxylesterase